MTTSKPATMATIRAALPQYFAANLPELVRGLAHAEARTAALALALTGGAIERAQSGNLPKVWFAAREALGSLKGGTLKRAERAIAIVEAIKPGHLKGEVAAFEAFADALHADVRAALAPPAPKVATPSTAPSWKDRALSAEAERDALIQERDALSARVAQLVAQLAETGKRTRKAATPAPATA